MSAGLFFQYLLPHRLLSSIARWLAYGRFGPWKNWLIRLAVKTFNINVDE
ncbi:MAG: phosphatidylserine decarboxylase, partial [Frankiaceae bacterium]|nr:phosphatidylserine decarboxylase [Arenimonas sp.]